ncbi:MAG: 16S rRNA processing protein RimM [Deltaproteobacteria bacterium]|nr:16S rRNA processing protein RimM [Deltaproteobacteria bacterium]MBW2077095.1 16S rRNA processing protein RimM [Deltaproteobacteria bacterium]MBW2310899.1 16S rRNA processing protein RimM [Deltaproteobacteria bacterium]RLB32132.1 MAG: 16S rRNA processing protein RimM [Deltaproteobacteria bacterium]
MNSTHRRDFVRIGYVIRPHGVTGLLRIVSYAQSRETFLRAGSVFIGKAGEEWKEYPVTSIREHGSLHLLKVSEVDSVEKAEELRGSEICIRKEVLTEKEEGEFFHFELLDLRVYLDTGQYLGVLKGIFQTGSNDVYVIEGQGKEYLIPAIYQVVKEVNLSEKRMVISPMKGLLDL